MGIEVFPLPATGPSLAEITSAITTNAAPSSVTMPAITSSITTNAASSGVTMAAINTAVANNASPYGGTLTNLGVYTSNGASTTFSNLGGYKYLKFYVSGNFSDASGFILRLNGDTSENYQFSYITFLGNSANGQSQSGTQIVLGNNGATQNRGLIVEIPNSNSSIYKIVRAYGTGITSSTVGLTEANGVWKSTSAITSVTIASASGGNMSSPYIVGIGAS